VGSGVEYLEMRGSREKGGGRAEGLRVKRGKKKAHDTWCDSGGGGPTKRLIF